MIRVLIAEDEVILRKGIVSLIDWNGLDCQIIADVSNGKEACSYIEQNNVDLIVTDISMPQMTGLELANYAYEQNQEIAVIILTAYSNFEYAKQAIECGVYRYILKSNFVNELPIVVAEAAKVLKSKQQKEKFSNVSSDKMKSLFLKGVIDGTIQDEQKITQWFSLQEFSLKNYYLILFELNIMETSEFDKVQTDIIESTRNFLDLSIKPYPHLTCSMSKNTILTVINAEDESNKDSLYVLVLIANEILNTVKNYMSFDINIGISNQHSTSKNMKVAYHEAAAALGQIYSPDHICLYRDIYIEQSEKNSIKTKNIAEKILLLIKQKNKAEIYNCLDLLFQKFKKNEMDSQQIEIEILKLFSYCILNLSNYQIRIQNSESIYKNTVSKLMNISSPAVKRNILYQAFVQTIQHNCYDSHNCNGLVHQVNHYIKQNYMKAVKLDDLSNYLHVNSSYLSRLYKKETGKSIISYLNSYRIQIAKQLLLSGNYMIAEIGSMVGIDDPAYFTNVFTKYTGESPKNYYQNYQLNLPNK